MCARRDVPTTDVTSIDLLMRLIPSADMGINGNSRDTLGTAPDPPRYKSIVVDIRGFHASVRAIHGQNYFIVLCNNGLAKIEDSQVPFQRTTGISSVFRAQEVGKP